MIQTSEGWIWFQGISVYSCPFVVEVYACYTLPRMPFTEENTAEMIE